MPQNHNDLPSGMITLKHDALGPPEGNISDRVFLSFQHQLNDPAIQSHSFLSICKETPVPFLTSLVVEHVPSGIYIIYSLFYSLLVWLSLFCITKYSSQFYSVQFFVILYNIMVA